MEKYINLEKDVADWMLALEKVAKFWWWFPSFTVPVLVSEYRDLVSDIIELVPENSEIDDALFSIYQEHKEAFLDANKNREVFFAKETNPQVLDRIDNFSSQIASLPVKKINSFLKSSIFSNQNKAFVLENTDVNLFKRPWILQFDYMCERYVPFIAQQILMKYKWWLLNDFDVSWNYAWLCQMSWFHPFWRRDDSFLVERRNSVVDTYFWSDWSITTKNESLTPILL